MKWNGNFSCSASLHCKLKTIMTFFSTSMQSSAHSSTESANPLTNPKIKLAHKTEYLTTCRRSTTAHRTTEQHNHPSARSWPKQKKHSRLDDSQSFHNCASAATVKCFWDSCISTSARSATYDMKHIDCSSGSTNSPCPLQKQI